MRLFNLLKRVCYKLGLIANFIIEEYDEDIWHVVKYYNGTMVAYTVGNADVSITGTIMGTLMGGYYTRGYISRPSEFLTITSKVGYGRVGTGGGFINIYPQTNNIMIDITGNQRSASMSFSISLIGTWK